MQSEITNVQYWDQYWDKNRLYTYNINSPNFYSLHLIFLKVIKVMKKELGGDKIKIIDIGCGNGMLLKYLAKEYDCLDIYGVENSQVVSIAQELNRALQLGCKIYKMDLMSGEIQKFYNKFDIVVSMGLIEHFINPFEPLKVMKNMLHKKGCLITVIPNFEGAFGMLWKLYDKQNYKYHCPISSQQLLAFYNDLGLKDIRLFYLGIPTFPGLHNKRLFFQKICNWIIRQINGQVMQKLLKKQKSLTKIYPMQPSVGCIGFLENS